jgi:hypothetical protein
MGKKTEYEMDGHGDSLFDIGFISDIIPFQITGIGIQCDDTNNDKPITNNVSPPFKELPADYTVIIL